MPARILCGATIFVGAFLLFQVEPIIAKIILPWFGGVAAVWSVCLLFFQVVLLLGYLYAHWLTHRFPARIRGRIHCALIAGSFLLLPILPRDSWKPSGPGSPAWHVLLLLAATVGLPYFLLSSTSPLLQAWFSRTLGGARPYRLYALSNAGSLLGLVSYPFVEPVLATARQALIWSVAYAAAGILCGVTVLAPGAKVSADESAEVAAAPAWNIRWLWLALAACGSTLLLAVTNHISQNIALDSVPVDCSAGFVSSELRALLRGAAAVSPWNISPAAWSGSGRHGLRARAQHRQSSADRFAAAFLRRIVHLLHGLPWRTGATQAARRVVDVVLFDDGWRRRHRGDLRSTAGPAHFLGILRTADRTWKLREC